MPVVDAGRREPVAWAASGDSPVPRWVPLSAVTLSVVGLVVSAYLTVEHFSAGVTLSCPEGTVVNCQKVTSSPQSRLFGVPVPLLGLGYFTGLLPLMAPVAWRSRRRSLLLARLVAVLAGVVMVAWLVYVELFVLDAICLWCTVVHVATIALFAVTVLGTALSTPTDAVDLPDNEPVDVPDNE